MDTDATHEANDRSKQPPVPAFMTEQMDAPDVRKELQSVLAGMRDGAGSFAVSCEDRANRLTRLDTSLKLSATVLAALAAVSVLADALGPIFTGLTAAAAAIITGAQTTFNPAAKAARQTEVGIEWGEFSVELHENLLFDAPLMDSASARALYRETNRRWFELMRKSYLGEQLNQAPRAAA